MYWRGSDWVNLIKTKAPQIITARPVLIGRPHFRLGTSEVLAAASVS